MVDDATAGATFRVLAKWLTSLEASDMGEPLTRVTLTATMPQQDLLDLMKVLANAAS
jgi:hypothetical protein